PRLRGQGRGREETRSEQGARVRVGTAQLPRHPPEERDEERGACRVYEHVDEVVRPWLVASQRVVEGPGPGEQRPRRLVAEDAPPRGEVADRRVAQDQLAVVVHEA